MLANIIRNSKKSVGGGGGGIVIDGGDPYYSAVSLMLSMDGTNGSTTFTDSGPNAFTLTRYGTAAVSTTQSKYGGASGYFDGSGARIGLSSTAIDFGTGDFTTECWIYLNASPSSANAHIMGKHVYGTGASWILQINTSRVLSFLWNDGANILSTGTALNLSQWYHIAACRSGSTLRVFINGTQVATTTISYTFSSTTEFTVCSASNDNALSRVNAYIDDLRISRFARYASNFTPPTAALPTTASSTVADPYYNYTSLLLHMDGTNASTNFVDSGPNALAVTATSSTISTTQSKYGGASGYFDGSTGYLSLTGNSSFQFGTGDFTIEAWVYISANAANQQTFLDTRGAATATPFTFGLYQSKLAFYDGTMRQSSATVTTGQWYHFAACRSGGTLRLFIDGIIYYSASNTTNFTTGANSIYIGRGFDSAAYYTNGHMDDLRVTKYARYTSAFTPPAAALPEFATGNDRYFSNVSLLLHMDGANGSTTFTDNSSNVRTVTAVGNAQMSTTQSQFGGAAAYFDGTGDYLSLSGGMPSGTGTAFTIECWIRLDDLSAYRAITRTAGGLDIGVQPSGMIVCDQTSVGIIANSATGVITAGTWYHVAVTRDTSNNYKIYVNGTQVASATNAFSVTAATTIGFSAFSGAHYFKGYIDDFRVTNALRYTANFTPPTSAFPNT
jgi:hypothetical protein